MAAIGFSDSDEEEMLDSGTVYGAQSASEDVAMSSTTAHDFAASGYAYGAQDYSGAPASQWLPPSASGLPFEMQRPYSMTDGTQMSAAMAMADPLTTTGYPPSSALPMDYYSTAEAGAYDPTMYDASAYDYSQYTMPYATDMSAMSAATTDVHVSDTGLVSESRRKKRNVSEMEAESIGTGQYQHGWEQPSDDSYLSTAVPPTVGALHFGASLSMRADGSGELWLSGPPPRHVLDPMAKLRLSPQKMSSPTHRETIGRDPLDASTKEWIKPPTISSIGIQCNCGVSGLNLWDITKKLNNVTFDPKEFVVVRHRLRNPKADVAIYRTGTLAILGMKSIGTALIALRKTAKKLRDKMGIAEIAMYDVSPMFIHASAKAPFGIDLQRLADACPDKADLNLELAQYCVYRETKYALSTEGNIYSNGTINVSNVKALPDVISFLDEMYELCKPFAVELKTSVDESKVDAAIGRAQKGAEDSGHSDSAATLTTTVGGADVVAEGALQQRVAENGVANASFVRDENNNPTSLVYSGSIPVAPMVDISKVANASCVTAVSGTQKRGSKSQPTALPPMAEATSDKMKLMVAPPVPVFRRKSKRD